MDKQEYKILSEEIMSLVAQDNFAEAVEIADQIDWRKVKSFTMLQKISDLYKINRRYDEALEIIGYAYDRNPNSKAIVYEICDLYLENGDLVSALQYMNLYKKMAPNDVGNAILKYKILEMEEASFEDRVEQLEKIVSISYQEEWAYQLAYMYHRMGLATKCVECCNQLISWFGDGPVVIKTMELKMLHEKLSPSQQEIYDHRNDVEEEIEAYEGEEIAPGQDEIMPEEEDFRVKTIDMSKYNTINLQKALAESMRELMGEDTSELINTSRITGAATAPISNSDEIRNTTRTDSKKINEKLNNTVNYNVGTDMNSESLIDSETKVLSGNTDDYNQLADDNYINGYTDENGVFIEGYTDENGNFIEGHTDENGNFIEGYTDENGIFIAGIFNENGDFIEGYTNENGIFIEGYTDESGIFIAGFTDENGDFIEGYTDENGNFVFGYTDENGVFIPDEYNDNYNENASKDEIIEENNFEENNFEENNFEERKVNIKDNGTSKIDVNKVAEQNEELEDETRFITPSDVEKNNITDPVLSKDAIMAKEDNMPASEQNVFFDDKTGEIIIDAVPLGMLNDLIPGVEFVPHEVNKATEAVKKTAKETVDELVKDAVKAAASESSTNAHLFDDVLSVDDDGQLKVLVPDKTIVDRQITGQMNIEDVLSTWEKEKKARDNKQKAEIKQRILEQTGEIFVNYDESKKNGIVAQIEKERKAQKRVLKNELELKKLDEISQMTPHSTDGLEKVDFDATAALNKVYGSSIWEEVEKANEREALESAMESARIIAGNAALDETQLDDYIEEQPDNYEAEYSDEYSEGYEAEYGEVDGEYSEYADTEMTSGDEYVEEQADEYVPMEESEEYSDEYVPTEESEEYLEEYSDESTEYTEEAYPVDEDEYVEEPEYTEEATYEEEYSDEYVDENIAYESGEELVDEDEYVEEVNDSVTLNTEQIYDISSALEYQADTTKAKAIEEIDDSYNVNEERDFSPYEQELFADFLYSKKMRKQILEAVDIISLAPFVGNAIITGEQNADVMGLAKALVYEIQMIDSNFDSSKFTKISGMKMNQKDISGLFKKLGNGALIVEKAGRLNKEILENITKALDSLPEGLIIIFTDTKKEMDKLIRNYDVLKGYFGARVDILPMNDNALVEYAKKYAYSKEYKIDEEKAVLALHARINELRIGEHNVTTKEVETIVDNAITHSQKPHLSTFANIIAGKRYDYDDMIILREKDFGA